MALNGAAGRSRLKFGPLPADAQEARSAPSVSNRMNAPQPQPQMPQLMLPRITPVVRAVLIANGVLFLLRLFADSFDVTSRYFNGAFVLDVQVWRDFAPFVPVWQLLTYGFLHDLNGLGHLAFNMLGLYFFGTMLEARLGSRKFAVAYGVAIAGSGLLHLVILLATGQPGSVVGASGGVMAVLVACAVLWPTRTVIALFIPVQLRWLVLFLVAGDALMLVREAQGGGSTNVAHWVHLGGAAIGFCGIRFGWFQKDPIARLQTKVAARKAIREIEDDQRVDAVLAKIQREGMASLTRSEKELLKRTSKRKSGA